MSSVGAMNTCPPCALTADCSSSFHRFPFPMVFSSCSKKDLEVSLEKGVGMCLFNLPEVKQSFGGQKCGNGYVEQGEECDCGEPEVRDSPRDVVLRPRLTTQGVCARRMLQNKSARNSGGKVLNGHLEQPHKPR